jgi:hypothetical protein
MQLRNFLPAFMAMVGTISAQSLTEVLTANADTLSTLTSM